jgi:hypothetical protein
MDRFIRFIGFIRACRVAVLSFCVLPVILNPPKAHAQTPAETGRVLVTVADPSGAVIPGARVTLAGEDDRTRAAVLAPVFTSSQGLATIEALALGRYTVQAEFAGFETVQVRDYRVRAGDNKRTVTLPIKKVAEDVVVGQDKRRASLDPRGDAFSTVLTREQIAMLPDDPDELEAVLKAMSPPGATLRVDGFSGGRLPPKSQIRSIRLPRMDQFAAQNHGSMTGMLHIDIMTQPGSGPMRGSLDFTFRDDALNARNPFTPVKGLERLEQGGASVAGTIVPNRSSFSFTAQTARQLEAGAIFAAIPGETDARGIVQPTERSTFTGRFDQATTRDRLLRFSFSRTAVERRNLGVGGFDRADRAFQTASSDNVFRVSENGPVGRRLFSESRLQLRWSSSTDTSVVEQPTMRVLDAFTSGGAQRAGQRRAVDIEAATDLDYVRGSHALRTGLILEGGRYRSSDSTNYLGTYTFASLADFNAGRPSNFTRRIGDPTIAYTNLQVGAYLQDDYRIARSLLLSYGVRAEAQTLIADQNNISPRATLTWSPFKDGKTTLRGGWGFFTDWLGTGVYETTLRLDGSRQRELNILDPSFPDPGLDGVTPPTNRYLLGGGLVLPESMSANLGVDRQIGQALRLSATYTHRRASKVLRGRNLNAPIDGVRPDAAFSNVIEVIDDAESRTHMLGLGASFLKLDWRQTFLAANYTMSSTQTNATGAFSPPADGDDLAAEWAEMTPRHRVAATFNTQPIRDLTVALTLRAQSGSPYTITTGVDTNGDGVFTDRPAGVARNSARTTAQWDLGLRVSYAIGFGTRQTAGAASSGGGQVVVMGAGSGGAMGGFGGGAANARFRLEFFAAAQNVTDHKNFIGYSGVQTSPFFGEPTNVLNPRKIEVGMRFGF